MTTTTWQSVLSTWGLLEPDSGRLDRASSVILTRMPKLGRTVFQASGHYQTQYGEVYPTGFKADCNCEDFRSRQQAISTACKHIVRMAQQVAKEGEIVALPTASTPTATSPIAPLAEAVMREMSREAAEIAIGKAKAKQPTMPTVKRAVKIGKVFVGPQPELIYSGVSLNKVILLAGPTGTGKTLAVEEVVQYMGLPLTRIEGKEGVRHEVA